MILTQALSDEEKNVYSDLIEPLLSRKSSVVKEWKEKCGVHEVCLLELSNAFKYIIAGLGEMKKRFIKQAYIFYSAQN